MTPSPLSLFPAGAVINCECEGFEQAAAVALRWNVETAQLQRGVYRFSTCGVHTSTLQIARTWRSLGTRLGGKIPPGSVVLAFALNPGAQVQFRGRQVNKSELIVQDDTCGLDFSFMNEIDIVTLAVRRDELDRRAMSLWQKPFPLQNRTGVLRFSEVGARELAGQRLSALLEEELKNPGRLAQPTHARALENAALDTLLGQIDDRCKAIGTVDRHKAARRAAGILHDRCREDISITDLCGAVGANRRTLHLGFLELYGIPPMKYLRALRLCRARREILAPRDPDVRVTDVAMTWGFSHLGRFSASYRAFFGKLPSAE